MFQNVLVVAAATLAVAANLLSVGTHAAILRGTIDCGTPQAVFQGDMSYASTKMGSTVRYRCMRGTTMTGSSSATCTKFGTWSQNAPTCTITYTTKNDNTYRNNDPGYRLYSG